MGQNGHEPATTSSPAVNRRLMASSTSAADLSSSQDEETRRQVSSILKKDSKYGSRRELPALGVSGVVSKSRPSIFEFWESLQQQLQPTTSPPPDGTTNNASPAALGVAGAPTTAVSPVQAVDSTSDRDLRSSMRRLLPALPNTNGHSSLTVYTGQPPPGQRFAHETTFRRLLRENIPFFNSTKTFNSKAASILYYRPATSLFDANLKVFYFWMKLA